MGLLVTISATVDCLFEVSYSAFKVTKLASFVYFCSTGILNWDM